MGCAGSDHKRKYFPFPGGPYPCPQNKSLDCSGYVDGARWQAPHDWDSKGAMTLDYGNGGKAVDAVCSEVSEGVFERKYAKYTVRLDCNTWQADFVATGNKSTNAFN
jgi:hypothetical protein